MEDQVSQKAVELVEIFKKTEASWTKEREQKDEFIRRRDRTIVLQIETINSVSKEVEGLSEKNSKLEKDISEVQKTLDSEKSEKQKLQMDKVTMIRKYLEKKKEMEVWKTKYNNLKTTLKEECKRRAEALSVSDDDESIPSKSTRVS